jgi:acyl-CoA reductase-like NAD-dependent aldehyde dehydrogenase
MSRLEVRKTYKLYIGGKFPRTESGRTYELVDRKGGIIANICRGSRKDFRNAVVAARKAQPGWAGTTAYLKGQILYRVAEVLEGRSAQFVEELVAQGATTAAARKEVEATIDLLVHYAGWSDKYQAVFSSVNPVAGPHFNFSRPESTGVVAVVAPSKSGLLGLASVIAPAIVGGNTVVLLASEGKPLSAVSLAEVLATSDVPGGVVNILTGHREELLKQMASHMDVNAIILCSPETEERKLVQLEASHNVKRVLLREDGPLDLSPYHVMDLQEIKTTWHPVGV